MGGGNRSTGIHFCGLQTWQGRKEEGRRQGNRWGMVSPCRLRKMDSRGIADIDIFIFLYLCYNELR